MKNLVIIAMLTATFPTAAYAGRQAGKIDYISADRTHGNGLVTVRITGSAATQKPTCATDGRWALDVGNSNGANQYLHSVILTAMASGWQVLVTGTGTCTATHYIEDIAYIEVSK